jgi:hypothetical protein
LVRAKRLIFLPFGCERVLGLSNEEAAVVTEVIKALDRREDHIPPN